MSNQMDQSSTTSLIDDIKQKTQEITNIKAELVEKLKPQFKDIFTPLFNKWPQIKSVYWCQYTPYFNDGESCEFSVGDLYASIYECHDEFPYDGDLPISDYYFSDRGTDAEANYQKEDWNKLLSVFKDEHDVEIVNSDFIKVKKAISEIPDDIMKDIFGDHVTVIVTRDSISVDEYDHE